MDQKIERAISKAIEVRQKYNPKNLSPFPYENIESEIQDLKFAYVDFTDDMSNVSGVIFFEKDAQRFTIIINKNDSKTRQHFTLAHELGHYFLHQDKLKIESAIIDRGDSLDSTKMLFRLSDQESSQIEKEANNFAAELIMPENLVREVWGKVKDIEETAEIFDVSPLAMSIRLERLKLLES